MIGWFIRPGESVPYKETGTTFWELITTQITSNPFKIPTNRGIWQQGKRESGHTHAYTSVFKFYLGDKKLIIW